MTTLAMCVGPRISVFRPGGSSLALTGRNNDGNPGSSALQTPILHPDIQEPKNLDTVTDSIAAVSPDHDGTDRQRGECASIVSFLP